MYRLDVLDDYISVDVLKNLEPKFLQVKPWYFGCDTPWEDPNRKITLYRKSDQESLFLEKVRC